MNFLCRVSLYMLTIIGSPASSKLLKQSSVRIISSFDGCRLSTVQWGTEELVVSFDGANISMPGEMQDPNQPAWYHIDQDPDRRGCLCVQGLVNLNVNVRKTGPADLDGS